MSSYLNEADSDEEEGKPGGAESTSLSEEAIAAAKESAASHKSQGNDYFSAGDFENALKKYTEAINVLKQAGLGRDSVLLLNRSAAYIGLKRFVPALNDANQAAEIDPTNWKAHWRKGVSLMSMTKKRFRTQQAIEAFEACLKCDSLPENKKAETASELKKARARLEQQDAETPPADLSNCAPS